MGRRIFFGLAGVLIVLAVLCGVLVGLAGARHVHAPDMVSRLGRLDDVLRRYPPREANASALELERSVAALGIDLAPRSFSGRAHPDADVAAAWNAVAGDLQRWLREVLERPDAAIGPPPERVGALLGSRSAAIAAVIDRLRRDEAPRWQSEMDRLYEARLPNLLGHLGLVRLLVGESLRRERSGDRAAAEAALDAAWRLQLSLVEEPVLISRFVGFAETRLVVGALRHVAVQADRWDERLAGLRPREALIESLELETWVATQFPQPAAMGPPLPEWAAYRLLGPYVRLCATDAVARMARKLDRLAHLEHLCDRNLAADGADLAVDLPRWNLLGGMVVPNLSGTAERVARLELDIELTRRILAIEAGGLPGGAGPTATPSTVCPDDRWIHEATADGGYRLSFSRSVAEGNLPGFELPLAYTVGPGR